MVHIELQSTNDPNMALRMAQYCLRVYRLFGKFPQQVLVYVGEAPMRMGTELRGPSLQYSYRMVDIREFDGERLLESPRLGDNIIAILTRLPDLRGSIHRIMQRIAALEPGQREGALRRLMILAGLRRLGPVIDEEARQMPILNDIMDHEVLGREFKKGQQLGEQRGEQRGELRGELKGELRIMRRLIERRFGSVPDWAEERLSKLSAAELEALSVRVLDGGSLAELLQ